MTIDATPVNMTPSSVILNDLLGVIVTLELRTMKGVPFLVHLNHSFPKDPIEYRDKPGTLGELVEFILRRQHPQIEYIAEQKGVKVTHYFERLSFAQSMNQINYSS